MLQVTVREHHKEYLPDDFCHQINILNAVYEARATVSGKSDYRWMGSTQHAVKVFDDYHYLVEVAVPRKEIRVAAVAGQTSIGIDFCANGTDAETGEYSYFDWCHLNVFHDPSRFGELVLQGPRFSRSERFND